MNPVTSFLFAYFLTLLVIQVCDTLATYRLGKRVEKTLARSQQIIEEVERALNEETK